MQGSLSCLIRNNVLVPVVKEVKGVDLCSGFDLYKNAYTARKFQPHTRPTYHYSHR